MAGTIDVEDRQDGSVYRIPRDAPYDTARYRQVLDLADPTSALPPEHPERAPRPGGRDVLASLARYGLPIAAAAAAPSSGGLSLLALLGGAGAAAGEGLAQAVEGRAADSGAMARAGVYGAAGGPVGAVTGKLAGLLGKLRPNVVGQTKDAAMVGQALGQAAPLLRPTRPGIEGLQEVARVTGKPALQASREAGLADLTAQTGQAAETSTAATLRAAPPPSAVSPTVQARLAAESGTATRDRLAALVRELQTTGRRGYSATTGDLRNTPGALTALRDRAEILDDLRTLLGPERFGTFQRMQQEFAGGSELLHLFKPTGKVGNPLDVRGLGMPELQRRVGAREGELRSKLGPEAEDFIRTIFRGGRPPVGDRKLQIDISRLGGMRIPLGLTRLAGPAAAYPWMRPAGTLAGLGLSHALQDRD